MLYFPIHGDLVVFSIFGDFWGNYCYLPFVLVSVLVNNAYHKQPGFILDLIPFITITDDGSSSRSVLT